MRIYMRICCQAVPLYFLKLSMFMRKSDVTDYELRGSSTSLQIPFPRTENIKQSFSYDGAKLWNSLPEDLRDSATLPIFKSRISAHNFS